MSLKRTADRLAQKTMRLFREFLEEVTYERVTGTTDYDVATDTTTETKTTYVFKAALLSYDENQQSPNYSATALYTGGTLQNQKAVLLFARLDVSSSFDPEVGDNVIRPNGEVWSVLDAKNPPGAAVFKLGIQRVS